MDGIALFERHLGNPPRHPKAELDLPDVDIAVEHEGGVILRPEFGLQVEREEGCRAGGGQHERRDGDAQGFHASISRRIDHSHGDRCERRMAARGGRSPCDDLGSLLNLP
jgi:hypothetical protein